jgi:thioredoxin reductase
MSSNTGAADEIFDVIIVGGGPAGLSGALVLGRCRRRVLLLDEGLQRNAASAATHGFFTRDGAMPAALYEAGREQLTAYDVHHGRVHVERVQLRDGIFTVSGDGQQWHSRKLLLATGVRDRWLESPGAEALAGVGVYQCPYCDGWEVRDRALGLYAPTDDAADVALGLKAWSDRVSLFTNGRKLAPEQRARLERHQVRMHESRVLGLIHGGGRLQGLRLEGNEQVAVDALFVHAGQESRSRLAEQLGCPTKSDGRISVGQHQDTPVHGLYVAGDLSAPLQAIAIAVAEGYKAGVYINRELREEAFR